MYAIRKEEKDSLGRPFFGGYTGVISASVEECVNLAMAFDDANRIGTKCFRCGKTYETREDLDKTVWLGKHSSGHLICEKCWKRRVLS